MNTVTETLNILDRIDGLEMDKAMKAVLRQQAVLNGAVVPLEKTAQHNPYILKVYDCLRIAGKPLTAATIAAVLRVSPYTIHNALQVMRYNQHIGVVKIENPVTSGPNARRKTVNAYYVHS